MEDELICPLCGLPITAGQRRVSWFAHDGSDVSERGAAHLVCLSANHTNRSQDA